MFGIKILDFDGIEGLVGDIKGFGFFNVEILMILNKSLIEVNVKYVSFGIDFMGYEIYIGCIDGFDCVCVFVLVNNCFEGVVSESGKI